MTAEQDGARTLHGPRDQLEGLRTYVDGKMKRYSLLFAVNGGAFAIAQAFGDPESQLVVGGLKMSHVAVGAIAFTILVTIDIYTFGAMMRREFFDEKLIFANAGKTILILLAMLIVSGWSVAALGTPRALNP